MTGGARQDAASRLLIPRIVHRIWLGGDEPEWARRFANSWSRPGWEIRLWTDANVGSLFPLRNQAVYDRAEEIAPAHIGQLRADVLRYEILERFGGIYVDADFELLRPLEPLICGVGSFAAWEAQDRWIANGLMGAVPGHPFIRRLVKGLSASVVQRPGQRPARTTGPQYLTRTYRRTGELERILDQSAVFPYNWDEVAERGPGEDWGEAIAVHHWANQRRERGLGCPA